MKRCALLRLVLACNLFAFVLSVEAADGVATIKLAKGDLHIERGGKNLPVTVGTSLLESDTVATEADGSAGLTFLDGTLVSLGPNSRFVIDSFRFDHARQGGEFQSTLSQGRMAVVSGKIAKSRVDAMKVRTPTSLLGVRGTEFLVEAGQ